MVVVYDLDDTLYDEIDFVKSGFKEVGKFLGDEKYFDFMWREFLQNGSGKIFDNLIKTFNLDVNLDKLVEIYRFHFPNISLPYKKLLYFEKTALITDGHYITQKNKFYSLGLDRHIGFAVFTDFYHTKKPEPKPFEMVMQKYPKEEYIYIADNPKKDFIAPKQLGWKTIRFKNPNGIYKDIANSADIEVYSREDILREIG